MKTILSVPCSSLEYFLIGSTILESCSPRNLIEKLYTLVERNEAINYRLDCPEVINMRVFLNEEPPKNHLATTVHGGIVRFENSEIYLAGINDKTGKLEKSKRIVIQPGFYKVQCFEIENMKKEKLFEQKIESIAGKKLYRLENIIGPLLGCCIFLSVFIIPVVCFLFFRFTFLAFEIILFCLATSFLLTFLAFKYTPLKTAVAVRQKLQRNEDKKHPAIFIILNYLGSVESSIPSHSNLKGIVFGPSI